MTKKQQFIGSVAGLVIGVIGGVAGTSYALGANKQRINDTLAQHALTMVAMQQDDIAHEKAIQAELNRFIEIVASPMTVLHSSIIKLTSDIANLRTDVQVLKVLMERMDRELRNPS